MSRIKTVTIRTDGLRDYVVMPDGRSFILGSVSVLQFAVAAIPGREAARRALKQFNKSGEVMTLVDLDALEQFLQPHRARFGQRTSPLIAPRDCTPLTSTESLAMSLSNHIGLIERTVGRINRLASAGQPTQSERVRLRDLVAKLHIHDFGDQSDNSSLSDLGEPVVDTVEPGEAYPAEVTTPKLAADGTPETAEDAAMVAEQILEQVQAADTKIDELEAEGRQFNAAKARQDLHRIASQVENLVPGVAALSVRRQLRALASESDRIHSIFSRA